MMTLGFIYIPQITILHCWNELPHKVLTNHFPNDVLLVQFFFGFEEGKVLKVFVFTQKFAKFIEDVRIAEEIFTFGWTVGIEGFLNIFEHHSETLL
jgi:hypothetical protein